MPDELLDLEDSLLLDGDDDRFLLLLLFTEDDEVLLLFLASSANSAGANDFTMAFKAVLSDTEDNSVAEGRGKENVIETKKQCKQVHICTFTASFYLRPQEVFLLAFHCCLIFASEKDCSFVG